MRSAQAQYQTAEDDRQRHQLAFWVDYYQALLEAAPTLRLCLPNVTVANHMALHGAARSAELMRFVGGHTASDCTLCLLDEGIVFMGDLLFVEHHPYLEDGDPDELLRILEAVRGLNPKILVPGHGPVGALADLKPMIQYVSTQDELARKMVQDGEAEERINEMAIPEPFANWRFAAFFAPNMKFLYQRQLSRQGGVTV